MLRDKTVDRLSIQRAGVHLHEMRRLCLHHQPVQGARKVQSQNNSQGDERGGQRHKQGGDDGSEPAFSDIVSDNAAINHSLPRFFKSPHGFDAAGQKGYGGQENPSCDDQEAGTSPGADG